MVSRKKFKQIPLVSFAEPFTLEDISPEKDVNRVLPHAIAQAKQLMTAHISPGRKNELY
jgi:hypothetical protein